MEIEAEKKSSKITGLKGAPYTTIPPSLGEFFFLQLKKVDRFSKNVCQWSRHYTPFRVSHPST